MDSERPVQQASAIPYRRDGEHVEYCLITASRSKRWGFPKGVIERGDTYLETALIEAEEEAGLYGRIVGPPLGSYEYHKWGGPLRVVVVMMEVSRAAPDWPESSFRERRWVQIERARNLLCRENLREMLETAHQRLCAHV